MKKIFFIIALLICASSFARAKNLSGDGKTIQAKIAQRVTELATKDPVML